MKQKGQFISTEKCWQNLNCVLVIMAPSLQLKKLTTFNVIFFKITNLYCINIQVQNLFENTPIRKKALKSSYEELQHISDIVKKYSIHNSTVQFNLKRVMYTFT